MTIPLLGLRTVIYKTPDLAKGKEFYSGLFGITPYFDEPFYVGYNVGGFELGLDPDTHDQQPGSGGATSYWGVTDIAAAMTTAARFGAKVVSPALEVGDGIKVGSLADPFGNVIGLIENPHFGKTN